MNKKIFFGILLLATFIRFIGIASRPIWYDEAFSILFAEKGIDVIVSNTIAADSNASAAEEHPPIYYINLWGWMKIFGISLISARSFSIFINLLSLLIVYKISEQLFNEKVAFFASGIFSLLPFQIHFAQEIRMYGLLSFFLLLTTFSYIKAKTNWRWWIIFTFASALAQYTHNLAAVYLIPLAITPIFHKDWKTLRFVILSALIAVALYIPWLINIPSQLSKVNSHYWIEKPGVEKIFTLILFYLPHLPLPDLSLFIGLLFALLIFVLGFFQTYVGIKNKTQNIRYGIWPLYLSFTPPLLLWIISQYIPVYIERALLPSHAIFCIWLAWTFTQTKIPRFIQIAAFFMIFVCAVIGFYQHLSYRGFPYGEFNEINKSIETRLEPGDVIIHSSKLSYLPAFSFDASLPQGFIIDPPNSNMDTLAPATREILQLIEYGNMEQATSHASRVWFLIFEQSILEYDSSNEKTHPHLEYLNQHFFLESMEIWEGIHVFLYQRATE